MPLVPLGSVLNFPWKLWAWLLVTSCPAQENLRARKGKVNTSHIVSSKHLINAQVINSLGSLGSGFYCLSSGNREMSVLGSSVIFPGPRSKPGVVPGWRWHPLSFWPGGLLFPCWWAEEWNRWEVVQRVLGLRELGAWAVAQKWEPTCTHFSSSVPGLS